MDNNKGNSGFNSSVGKNAIDLYLYGSVHIGLGALLMTAMTWHMTGQRIFNNYHYLISIFFGTIAFYSFHRVFDLDNKYSGVKSSKYEVIKHLRNPILMICFFSVIAATVFLFFLPPFILLLLFIMTLLTAWYSVPMGHASLKLREVAHIKIIVIAIIWGLLTAAIPAWLSGASFRAIFLLFLERSIYIFALTLPFDVRDYLLDKQQALKTLPIWLGKSRSIYLAVILLTILLPILNLINYKMNIYPVRSMVLLILTNLLTALFVGFSSKIKNDYYYTGLLDGFLIIQPVVLLLFYR